MRAASSVVRARSSSAAATSSASASASARSADVIDVSSEAFQVFEATLNSLWVIVILTCMHAASVRTPALITTSR